MVTKAQNNTQDTTTDAVEQDTQATTTDVVSQEDARFEGGVSAYDQVSRLSSGQVGVYSTFGNDSFDAQVATYAALSNAEKLADHIGTVINLKNFVTQVVEINDENTGEKIESVRVILVDESGDAYAAISSGIFSSLRNIAGIFGEPSTWARAIPVVVTEERSRKGFRFMTIKVHTGS